MGKRGHDGKDAAGINLSHGLDAIRYGLMVLPMKWLVPACALMVPGLSLAGDPAGSGWMRALEGNWLIQHLSIPGSHDSGAMLEPLAGTAKCQDLPIAEQLAVGVRFLDIRCRHVGDTFVIHHGPIDQKLTYENVLGTVTSFLKANPGECVILSVKEEYQAEKNTRSFEQTFDTYVAKDPERWWLNAELPRLDQVRGKILLFRRFSSTSQVKGIDASKWPDNKTFSSDLMRVQDVYQSPNAETKWRSVETMLKEAREGEPNPNILFVNFTSATGSRMGIPNIPSMSTPVNQKITAYLMNQPKARYGILVMDFVNEGRCRLIYETNLRKP